MRFHAQSKKKTILLDVSSINQYRGLTHLEGIGRSTLSLLKAFSKIDNLPFELILVSQRVRPGGLIGYQLPFRHFRIPVPNNDYFKKIVCGMRIKEILLNYDIIHIPHNTDFVDNPGKAIFTIHDLMFYKFPNYFPYSEKFSGWSKTLISNCRSVITCSQSSKNDIIKYWEVPDEKIEVIKWGVDRSIFFPGLPDEIADCKQKFGINNSFFLAVSCSHPRKNIELIINGFKKYKLNNGINQLVLIWEYPDKQILFNLQNELAENKIKIIKSVSDDELRALYSSASATLFPSVYEGFGFPILESLACHTPVVTCKNSSLEEIGSDLVSYTSETDSDEFSEKLTFLEKKQFQYDGFISKIENHLREFTWEKAANQYISVYLKQLGYVHS
jgi:glycosyltransferase involved in cell wall biosynthesis